MSDADSRQNFEFSPAAQAALQEATQEIANEISLRAAAIASKGGDEVTLIGVLDVAAALEESKSSDRRFRNKLRSLLLATVLYGVTGFGIVVYTTIKDDGIENALQFFGGIATGIGVPAATFWIIGLLDKSPFSGKETQAQRSELLEILQSWLMLESAIRAHYGSQYGESRASAPITEMIRVLERDGVIDSTTLEKLQRVQSARNMIAHGRDLRLTRGDVADLQKDSRSVLRAIERNWRDNREDPNLRES